MDIKLRLDNDMPITKKILEILKKNQINLGIREKELKELEKLIANNKKVPIIPSHLRGRRENYRIELKNQTIGYITTDYDKYEKIWEIDIVIFPEYRNHGYAKYATSYLLKMYPDRDWEITVLETNEKFEKIVHLVKDIGFIKNEVAKNSKGISVHNFRYLST